MKKMKNFLSEVMEKKVIHIWNILDLLVILSQIGNNTTED